MTASNGQDPTTGGGHARRLLPPSVRAFWQRAILPPVHRLIVQSDTPLRAYVHPHSHLGHNLITTGRYEVDTEEILRSELARGDVFLDIGANEGYLSAFAGTLVGPEGLVISIEPQSRLQPLIEINLRLNEVRNFRIFHRAIGEESGSSATINLYPDTNTGQSGLLKKPRFGWTAIRRQQEQITFISPEEILRQCGVDRFDMVKVDVEGFEFKVVDALLPIIRAGKVRKLLLDYHASILAKFGVDAKAVHQKLLDAGMRVVQGDSTQLESYLLYHHAAAGG